MMKQLASISCRRCLAILTIEEQEYYEIQCEACEQRWLDRIENWRFGAEDQEFDAIFNIPFG